MSFVSNSRIMKSQLGLMVTVIIAALILISISDAKDYKKDHPTKGGLCIARFDNGSGEPLYYTCPRHSDSEKKIYCCYLDKCCDYKEFQKQTEQQFKMSQGNYGYIAKGAIGGALKVLFWIVFLIILIIIGCCCFTFFLCRKKKLFQGEIFSSPLPPQPPGPSPYAPPTNPYMAYQWPPDTAGAPPAYPASAPAPAYPPYPSANNGMTQPPYNPNFK